MRKLLLIMVLALLVGAASIWLLQQGSGYVLIAFADISVEMSLWVATAIYLLLTGLLVWLLLALRWLLAAGGIRQWWADRRNNKHINKTAQGLLLFADQDWQKASAVLLESADRSSMPMVNLIFAARAAAENQEIDTARKLLERLKLNYPKARFLADKALAELWIITEEFEQAKQLLQSLHREKPSDTAVLRLLIDTYRLQLNWVAAQKLLYDIRRYGALNKDDFLLLETEVYSQLIAGFVADPELNQFEQQNQLAELWELLPRPLRKRPEIVARYADALARVNAREKLQPLLSKALNHTWHPDLVERFGLLETVTPEKQLVAAEKWLSSHGDDADLLLALGRICRRLGFKGKARDYFNSAVALEPCPQSYLELADILRDMDDHKGSANACRRGLELGLASADEQSI